MSDSSSRGARRTVVTFAFAVLAGSSLVPSTAHAKEGWENRVPNGAVFVCQTCHENVEPLDKEDLLPFADDFKLLRKDWSMLWLLDSDGDGQTNGEELGDPCGEWVRDGPPPSRTAEISNPADATSATTTPSVPACGAPPPPADADGGTPMMPPPGTPPGEAPPPPAGDPPPAGGSPPGEAPPPPGLTDYPPGSATGGCSVMCAATRGDPPAWPFALALALCLGVRRWRSRS